MVSILSGQSVSLWGHPSHVASCCSHSAGILNPSSAGVSSIILCCFDINSREDKIFLQVVHSAMARRTKCQWGPLPVKASKVTHSLLSLLGLSCENKYLNSTLRGKD